MTDPLGGAGFDPYSVQMTSYNYGNGGPVNAPSQHGRMSQGQISSGVEGQWRAFMGSGQRLGDSGPVVNDQNET